jgi:hypothetical protein
LRRLLAAAIASSKAPISSLLMYRLTTSVLRKISFLNSKEFERIIEIMDVKGVSFDQAVMEFAKQRSEDAG